MTADEVQTELRAQADPQRGQGSARFFKTKPGESGAGLQFLGLNAAALRSAAKKWRDLPLAQAEALLQSDWHDERAVALLILALQLPRAADDGQKAIYTSYLRNTHRINSWALVDCSAPPIVGAYLFERNRKPLTKLAKSKSLWERRIAMVATQYFIRQGDFEDTLRLAELLLHDAEDLIHKACGWMLREVGDRDQSILEAFLREHLAELPRTTLRYAIEKFTPARRKAYLTGKL